MAANTTNDAAGWIRLLESQMRLITSAQAGWEQWLGINTPYSPSPVAPNYISTSQFSLMGDWTSASAGFYPVIIAQGRRVKAFTGGNPPPVGITGTVKTATFGAGSTTVTVVWDNGALLDNTVSEVQFGDPFIGESVLPFANLYKISAQTLSGSITPESSLVFTMQNNDRWIARFILYLGGWSIGGGGSLTIGLSGPSGASYNLGATAAGVAWQQGASPTIALTSNQTMHEILLYAAAGTAGGPTTITYNSNGPTNVAAGSIMQATRVIGV
jgi:hypothetical protein